MRTTGYVYFVEYLKLACQFEFAFLKTDLSLCKLHRITLFYLKTLLDLAAGIIISMILGRSITNLI